MYLFTRTMQLAPSHGRDGIEWALKVTEKVNQITSLNVGLWTPFLSPGVGTLSWGTAVETLSDLEDAQAKLGVDPIFGDLADQGGKMITDAGIDDRTAMYVHNPTVNASASFVTVVEAQIANGQFQHGAEVGVEIAQRATAISGVPTAFLVGITGTYASCAWLSAAVTLRELEAGELAVNNSQDFVAYVDSEAAAVYDPGAKQAIWRRIV